MFEGKPKAPETLGEVLQQYLNAVGAARKISEMRIMEYWQKVVGQYAANDALYTHFKNGVLSVRFRSPMIRSEIFMRRSAIMQRLNEVMGGDIVKKMEIN